MNANGQEGILYLLGSKELIFLYDSLTEQHSKDSRTKKIIVGHSHGGSVISYALKIYPELREIITGVVLLSTPIIDARRRVEWYYIYVILASLIIFPKLFSIHLTLFSIAVEYQYCMGIFCEKEQSGDSDKYFFWTSLKWISTILGSIVFYIVALPKTAKYILRIENTIHSISTSEIRSRNVLIVKSTGDEAYGILSAAHIISWLISKILYFTIRPITFFLKTKLRAIIFFILFTSALFMSSFLWVLLASPPNDWTIGEGLGFKGTLTSVISDLFSFPPTIESIVTALLIYLPFIIPIWCVAMFLCALFGFIANLLFGKFSLLISLFVEISVEPSPDGAHTVYRDSWGNSSTYSGLSHSTTYQSNDAITYIGNWIKRIN